MWLSPITFVSSKICFRNVSLIRFFSFATPSLLETPFLEQQTTHTDNSELTTNAFIELTSVQVVQVFNDLRNDPNRALSFFDQLNDRDFSHNVNTYAAIVRILCCSRLDRKLGSILLELIRKENNLGFEIMELLQVVVDGIAIKSERSRVAIMLSDSLVKAFVKVGMFYEAIDVLFETNCLGFAPHIFSCNFLMNRLVACGKVDMAVAIYMQLKNIGLSPNDYTYSIAIKAFCVNGNFKEALHVFEQIEKDGVIPNKFACETFIQGLCRHGNSDSGFQLLRDWMESRGLISVYAYTVVIQGFCNEMQLDKAEEAFVEMQNKGLIPDVYAYSALIYGLCRAGNLRKAVDFHDEMTSRGINTNCDIVCSILQCLSQMCMAPEVKNAFEKFERIGIFLDAACYNVVMDAFCKLGEVEKAADILDKMKERSIIPDIANYTTLINAYFLKGEVGKAMDLVEEMHDNGYVPDIIFCDVMVGGLSRNGYSEEAFGALDRMKSDGIEPNTVTDNKIIEGLCIAGKVKQARAFFEKQGCVESYSSLVKGYCLAKHTDEAFQLFIKSSEFGDIMDRGSCWELLNNLVTEGKYENTLIVLKTMLALSIKPTNFMIRKLIGVLCENGQLEIARHAFDCLIETGFTPDIYTYTIMMNEYCRRKCLREAFDLLSDMKKKGIKPDVVTYSVLLDKCQRSDDMRDFLREMKGRGIALDEICYTVLIDKECKRRNVHVAECLFNKLIYEGLEPDYKTYTALMKGFYRAGDMVKAKAVVTEVFCKGIPTDERYERFKYYVEKASKKSDEKNVEKASNKSDDLPPLLTAVS